MLLNLNGGVVARQSWLCARAEGSSHDRFIGPSLYFHLCKINMKPPQLGSVVDWHEDLTFCPLHDTDSVIVLFYFQNADPA